MTSLVRKVHSRFSCSTAYRWLHCPTSVALTENLPSESNKEAMTGTYAHTLLSFEIAKILNKNIYNIFSLSQIDEATKNFNKMECSEKQSHFDGINFAKEYIQNFLKKNKVKASFIEYPINLAMHHPELYGHADYVFICDNIIHIMDYKHGSGVEIDYPHQGKMYSLMALNAHESTHKVYFHIIQPRLDEGDKIKIWNWTLDELEQFKREVIDAIVAVQTTTNLRVGKWCDKTFCPARSRCPAYTAETEWLLSKEIQLKGNNLLLNPHKIRRILKAKSSINKVLAGLTEHVIKEIQKDTVKAIETYGFVLKTHVHSRRWVDEDKILNEAKQFAPELLTVISPAKAERLSSYGQMLTTNKDNIKEIISKTLVDVKKD